VNRPDVIDEQFDQEYVVVNLRTGAYYSLNQTAAGVWDLLNQNLPNTEIVARTERVFVPGTAQLATDIENLLAELVREQLIVLDSRPSHTAKAPPKENSVERRSYIAPLMEKFTDMEAMLLLDPIHQVDASGWPSTKPDAR
jgi:hypothetical protein